MNPTKNNVSQMTENSKTSTPVLLFILFLMLMIHNVSNTFICCLQNPAVLPFCCVLKLVETAMVEGEEQGVLKKMIVFKLT